MLRDEVKASMTEVARREMNWHGDATLLAGRWNGQLPCRCAPVVRRRFWPLSLERRSVPYADRQAELANFSFLRESVQARGPAGRDAVGPGRFLCAGPCGDAS